jgi:hypothetical protein
MAGFQNHLADFKIPFGVNKKANQRNKKKSISRFQNPNKRKRNSQMAHYKNQMADMAFILFKLIKVPLCSYTSRSI